MKRFRLLREFPSHAGIGLECIGLTLHAPDAETAVRRARELLPWLPRRLVAIPETT